MPITCGSSSVSPSCVAQVSIATSARNRCTGRFSFEINLHAFARRHSQRTTACWVLSESRRIFCSIIKCLFIIFLIFLRVVDLHIQWADDDDAVVSPCLLSGNICLDQDYHQVFEQEVNGRRRQVCLFMSWKDAVRDVCPFYYGYHARPEIFVPMVDSLQPKRGEQ